MCSVLSRCGHAVLALLYPFTWQHTFIPVLPASMLDVSCSPTPFLIGVLAPCLPQLLELPIEEVGVPGRPLASRGGGGGFILSLGSIILHLVASYRTLFYTVNIILDCGGTNFFFYNFFNDFSF